MAYAFLAWFLRVVTRVFFRQIEVAGLENVPASGAVLFAGNHPNSLIDPILIITTCGRKVHFAAKDSLFKGRIMRAVLRGLGAVPVARRDDHAGDRGATNDAAFDAMFEVLGHGGAIGIFPEGLSHDESQLTRLKTGAARLALGGASKNHAPVTIVPCGLVFIHPKRFRSRVLVQFGPPIVIGPDQGSDKALVTALTGDLDLAIRRLTINAPDWDTVRALDVVRRLYQPHEISIEDRVELARRFNQYYSGVAADPRVLEVMVRVRAYQQKLDELGLTDRELSRDLSKVEISARMIRHLILVAFWLPLTAPGAPLHLPSLAFARLAGPRLTPRKDVIATTKLMIGMLLTLLFYGAAIALIGWKLTWRHALAAAIILPLSGWATLRVLDRLRLVRRALRVLGRQLRFRTEVKALRAERDSLAADVLRVVNEVKPPELEALFPPGDPRRDDAAEPGNAREKRRPRLRARCRRDRAPSRHRRRLVRPLVILLHGLARGHGSMANLGTHLRAHGFDTHSRGYPSRQHSIRYLADEVSEWLVEHAAGRPVSAVTHSMGGVIVRHMHDPRITWERIVMLAPPNRGSRLAAGLVRNPVFRWYYGPAGSELADGSTWPDPPAPFGVIAGTRAAWTNPSSWTVGRLFAPGVVNDGTVAVEETQLPAMSAFATVDATHTWIMNDARARELTVRFLRSGSF